MHQAQRLVPVSWPLALVVAVASFERTPFRVVVDRDWLRKACARLKGVREDCGFADLAGGGSRFAPGAGRRIALGVECTRAGMVYPDRAGGDGVT
jgi:hypothetical protein